MFFSERQAKQIYQSFIRHNQAEIDDQLLYLNPPITPYTPGGSQLCPSLL